MISGYVWCSSKQENYVTYFMNSCWHRSGKKNRILLAVFGKCRLSNLSYKSYKQYTNKGVTFDIITGFILPKGIFAKL